MTSTEHFRLLGGLLRRAESCSRVAVWAGGALTIASVLLISFDVLARKFLGFTTGGADELSSYAFAISTSWALAFATLQRANVRVDVLYHSCRCGCRPCWTGCRWWRWPSSWCS